MTGSLRADVRPLALLSIVGLALFAGCNSFRMDGFPGDKAEKTAKELGPPLPAKQQFRVGQYVFFADFEVQRDLPLFKELAGLREQLYQELQLPHSPTLVQIYVFEERERYERYMKAKYPDLPKRRAFFVAQPRPLGATEDLLVYTYWGEKVQQDLRHELTHALLHSVLKDVPLWLDEGLAEYFEVPPDWKGMNRTHLDQLCRGPSGPCRPDLARLEQLSQVQQMAPAEYREAWAWVHLLLNDSPETKAVLLGYLQQLRALPNPGPMRPRLAELLGKPEEVLSKHLTRWDGKVAAAQQR